MAWQLCCHGMCKILQWCDIAQWSNTETNFHQIWITTEKNCSWNGHLKISLTINQKKATVFHGYEFRKPAFQQSWKCFNHPCADTPISLLSHHNGCNGVWNHDLIVYSMVHSGADQIKHQSSASLAFARGIHRWSVNSPHKRPVTWKMFPFDDVIMLWEY